MDVDYSQPSSGVCSVTGAGPVLPTGGPCTTSQQQQPAAPVPSTSGQHAAFLHSYRAIISPKFQQLLTLLAGQEVARNLAVAQIWTYLPVLTEGKQILKAEQLCLLGDPELQNFHAACCQEGVTVSQLGPMGKVWESGAVQVVQCADSLSPEMHPCNRLPGEMSRRIAECIYVPLYDGTGTVSQGVLAVVELLIRRHSDEYMVVANAISCLTHLMEALQLSLCNPHQQQAPPSGSGRRSPPVTDGHKPPSAKRTALQMSHSTSCGRNNAAGGGGSGGSLGGMTKSMSMRTLA